MFLFVDCLAVNINLSYSFYVIISYHWHHLTLTHLFTLNWPNHPTKHCHCIWLKIGDYQKIHHYGQDWNGSCRTVVIPSTGILVLSHFHQITVAIGGNIHHHRRTLRIHPVPVSVINYFDQSYVLFTLVGLESIIFQLKIIENVESLQLED